MPIVWGKSENLPASLFEAILRYRYDVFVRLLGWKLATRGPLETDQFEPAGIDDED